MRQRQASLGSRSAPEDWIIDAPGLTTETYAGREDSPYCTTASDPHCVSPLSNVGADGSIFSFDGRNHDSCGCYLYEIWQAKPDGSMRLIAHIPKTRHVDGNRYDEVELQWVGSDPTNGLLYVRMNTRPLPDFVYPDGIETFRIRGLPTLFEIFESYVPAESSLGFTVPVMPEGMRSAERFDVYAGDLKAPIDFAKAAPIACDLTGGVGELVKASDALPNPPRGQGFWYLTAATHDGERRAGRARTNGHIHGRDSSRLPACVPALHP